MSLSRARLALRPVHQEHHNKPEIHMYNYKHNRHRLVVHSLYADSHLVPVRSCSEAVYLLKWSKYKAYSSR